MRRKRQNGDEKLDEVHAVMKDLLMLQCARTGMPRSEVRTIVAVDNNRISRIARHVRPPKDSEQED